MNTIPIIQLKHFKGQEVNEDQLAFFSEFKEYITEKVELLIDCLSSEIDSKFPAEFRVYLSDDWIEKVLVKRTEWIDKDVVEVFEDEFPDIDFHLVEWMPE